MHSFPAKLNLAAELRAPLGCWTSWRGKHLQPTTVHLRHSGCRASTEFGLDALAVRPAFFTQPSSFALPAARFSNFFFLRRAIVAAAGRHTSCAVSCRPPPSNGHSRYFGLLLCGALWGRDKIQPCGWPAPDSPALAGSFVRKELCCACVNGGVTAQSTTF